VICYSLFGNVSHAKTYPGILNISLSISVAHQSIDISKVSVYHLHYIMHVKIIIERKKLLQNHYNVSITGHKKLKKLKIGILKKEE